MNKSFTTAREAYDLVHSGKIAEMKVRSASYHFTWGEVFTKCTDDEIKAVPLNIYINATHHAQETMDKVRDKFGKPVNVHDWYRGNIVHDRPGHKTHDQQAGGTGNGYHPQGLATDFDVEGVDPHKVHDELDKADFMQHCGLEDVVYNGVHADSRGHRARFGPNR